MTAHRRAKRAIRVRMAETGEKYSQARRALTPPRPPGTPPPPTAEEDRWDDDAIGWFTDQAYNLILLAQDEARMLGRSRVEPEHLLLAIARSGNAHRLLQTRGITARAIHDAIVRRAGYGDELVLGRVPRSAAAEAVLEHAIAAAAQRGTTGPSSEHLLLGVAGSEGPVALLRELGVADVAALVDAAYPHRRPPLDPETVARKARVAHNRSAPRPGPIPPVFERFTTEAREAIEEGLASAARLEDTYVEPTHLLIGALSVPRGVVANMRGRRGGELEALRERATTLRLDARSRRLDALGERMAPPRIEERSQRLDARSPSPTSILADAAREIVAQDTLAVAHRLGHRPLTTGHLLLAILGRPDPQIVELRSAVPAIGAIEAEITDALPGDERM